MKGRVIGRGEATVVPVHNFYCSLAEQLGHLQKQATGVSRGPNFISLILFVKVIALESKKYSIIVRRIAPVTEPTNLLVFG